MLRIDNKTRGTVLVKKGREALTWWTRLKGLMGERDLRPGDGLLISPCSSIHCMWMAIAIDVLYCTRDDVVVGMDQRLRPWRIGSLHKNVQYVVELPAGTIARSATRPGDRLAISRLPGNTAG